jgi:hypothetical protein
MARSFAYNAQKTMAILWIPGNSETAIKQAFEQYARQICENDQQYSEPMSLIARQLSERFLTNGWLYSMAWTILLSTSSSISLPT